MYKIILKLFLLIVYIMEIMKISNVTDETFDFSPKVPEFLNYDETNCDVIEYSTKSKMLLVA